MKNLFKLLGIAAIVAVIGLTVAGCGSKCSEDGNCKLRSGASGNVLEAKSCFQSDCNTTKQANNEPGPNITVSCNCK
jgi:hypothetical protein